MADYLSRLPTELQGAAVKAETLWNERFTENNVICLNIDTEYGEATTEKIARNSLTCGNEKKLRKPKRKQDERKLRQVRGIVVLPK